MPSKNRENNRETLLEEYDESLFKLVMHDVAEKEGKLFLEEKEQLKADPEYIPSDEIFNSFNRQLTAYYKKRKNYAGRQRTIKALNRAAVIVLVMLAILFTSVMTVQAVRVRVLNFFMDIHPQYTSFQLKGSHGNPDDKILADWHKAYVPTYIPAGYKIIDVSNNQAMRKIEFKNSHGLTILYMEMSDNSSLGLDTENASDFETFDINGHNGTLILKNSLTSIIWTINERIFMIRGEMDKNTAVKMARGVKYID